MAQLFQAMLLGPVISKTVKQKMGNSAHKPNTQDLVCMKELLEAGKVKPVIDRRYPLRVRLLKLSGIWKKDTLEEKLSSQWTRTTIPHCKSQRWNSTIYTVCLESKEDSMNQANSSSSSSSPEPVGAGESLNRSVLKGTRMTYSRVIGALFLLGFLSYGVGNALVASVTGASGFLSAISAHQITLVLGAFLMLLNSVVPRWPTSPRGLLRRSCWPSACSLC